MSYEHSAKKDLHITGPLIFAVVAVAAICLFLASETVGGSGTQRSKVFVPTTSIDNTGNR